MSRPSPTPPQSLNPSNNNMNNNNNNNRVMKHHTMVIMDSRGATGGGGGEQQEEGVELWSQMTEGVVLYGEMMELASSMGEKEDSSSSINTPNTSNTGNTSLSVEIGVTVMEKTANSPPLPRPQLRNVISFASPSSLLTTSLLHAFADYNENTLATNNNNLPAAPIPALDMALAQFSNNNQVAKSSSIRVILCYKVSKGEQLDAASFLRQALSRVISSGLQVTDLTIFRIRSGNEESTASEEHQGQGSIFEISPSQLRSSFLNLAKMHFSPSVLSIEGLSPAPIELVYGKTGSVFDDRSLPIHSPLRARSPTPIQSLRIIDAAAKIKIDSFLSAGIYPSFFPLIPAQVHEVVLSHLLSGGLVLSVTPSGGANVPQVQSSSPTHLIYAHQGRMFLRLLCGPLLGPDVKAAALAPVSREQEFASMLKKSLIDLRTPSIASKKDVNQYFEHNKGLLASLFSPTWLPQASLLACIESQKVGNASRYKVILAEKVKAIQGSLRESALNVETFQQDLIVVSDLLAKSVEKQYVLPSGTTVEVIPTFWAEMLALAEENAKKSVAHVQAVEKVKVYTSKHPQPEGSIPSSPKKKGSKRLASNDSEMEVEKVYQSFDQLQNMTHRERLDLEKGDKNNSHFLESEKKEEKKEEKKGGYLDPQVIPFRPEDIGEEGSLLNRYWSSKNLTKKPKLDFSGRAG